jgi:predicted RNA-binding Zn ribbon-like protein
MDEADLRRVGEQVEPGGRPKAPGRLELLQRFLNSHNHDLPDDWDRIGSGRKAQSWLREKELIGPRERVTDAEATRLRLLREAIRALAMANHGRPPDPGALALIRLNSAEVRVTSDASGTTLLVASAPGVEGAIATLLGIVHEAQLSGDWVRMKGCRQCGYAFFDRSKNRSAAWCSMAICGNRKKNRAYYRRRRG